MIMALALSGAFVGCPAQGPSTGGAADASAVPAPPPCASLDVQVCASESRCRVQHLARVDLDRRCVESPLGAACVAATDGPDTPDAVLDDLGQCWMVDRGLAAEGFAPPGAEGDACGAWLLAETPACEGR